MRSGSSRRIGKTGHFAAFTREAVSIESPRFLCDGAAYLSGMLPEFRSGW
jgi:hypothetical protein